MLLLWLALVHLPWITADFSNDDKEIETVITGSKYSNGMGTIATPPGYPTGVYDLDATSHIYVLENVANEGSVELIIEDFDLHPLSWITCGDLSSPGGINQTDVVPAPWWRSRPSQWVPRINHVIISAGRGQVGADCSTNQIRNSKYGGYLGRVIGRYDLKNPPPGVIFTRTCCLRIEFQTGCCAPGEVGYSGFKATYRFVRTPGRGRRQSCDTDEIYSQLCNGECIPQVYSCPCPQYGQYKCTNGLCLAPEKVCNNIDNCGDGSDERLCKYTRGLAERSHQGSMYGFSVIISTVMAVVGTAFFLICGIRCVENRRSRRWKETIRTERLTTGPLLYAKIWPRPQVGVLPSPTPVRVIRQPPVVGRLPSVVVKPVIKHKPGPAKRDDDTSSSSHDESGFQGDDDVGLTSSSDCDVWVPRVEKKSDKIEERDKSENPKDHDDFTGTTCIGNG